MMHMRVAVYLLLLCAATYGLPDDQDIKASIRAALEANDLDLVASLTSQLQQARSRRTVTGPQITTVGGDIEIKVPEDRRVVVREGDRVINVGAIASDAASYTDDAKNMLLQQIEDVQTETRDEVARLSEETKATLKDITDVDISRLSGNIAASDAAVAGLKEELSSISTCNAKGMLYKADGDACIPPQIISCGALHLPKGSGRVSVDCTPIHPLTCDATCPEGYVGKDGDITSACGADGNFAVIDAHKKREPACVDVDECEDDENVCTKLEECENTMGSYKCKTKCAADVGTVMGDDSCKDLGVRNFRYDQSGASVKFVVPGKPKVDGNVQTVKYKIEVWGSGGQSTQNEPYPGGPGGYAKGVFTLKSGTTLMLALGGPAKGVGFGKQTVTKYLANGGGLSGVFFNEVKHENTIVIGGSGGGAGDNRARAGGAGGKVAGVGTYVDGRIAGTMGKGATQTAGGASGDMRGGGVRGDGGDKLQGGDSRHYGSGGGAGYFGGGAGSHYGSYCGCSGGGGSSYVETAESWDGAVKYEAGIEYKDGKGASGEPKAQRGKNINFGTRIRFTAIYS
eukprot:gene2112-31808_t